MGAGVALKPPRSLKARALQWLAQREQSRTELRRKLMPHAQVEFSAQQAHEEEAAEGEGEGEGEGVLPGLALLSADARVESVLDWLEAHQYLSQARFVESRICARAPRFGNLRIRHELKQHQAVLSPQAAQDLKDSELQRACTVRRRKFAEPPVNATERARQGRFLIGRGFSHDVVRRALRDTGDSGDAGDLGDPGDAGD